MTIFLDSCTGACASLYLRLLEDGASAPKHVGDFKAYVQLVNLLCACVGTND